VANTVTIKSVMNVSLEPIWSLKDAIDTALYIRFPFPVPEQMTVQSQRA